jgi:hypothetical protein
LVTWFALVPLALAVFPDLPTAIPVQFGTGAPITIHTALPFNWWLLWWSSFFYVLALSLYAIRCPSFVKRYKHYGAYKDYQHSKRWIVWEWNHFLKKDADPSDVDILIRKALVGPLGNIDISSHKILRAEESSITIYEPQKERDETWFALKRREHSFRLGMNVKDAGNDTKQSELFWELYGAQASSRTASRYTIWGLLAVAAVFFLIAVVQNIWTVIQHLGS